MPEFLPEMVQSGPLQLCRPDLIPEQYKEGYSHRRETTTRAKENAMQQSLYNDRLNSMAHGVLNIFAHDRKNIAATFLVVLNCRQAPKFLNP
jgi:hypothetical protein